MPHIDTMKESRFLTKQDVGPGKLLTIRDCYQENLAMEGAPPELEWCLSFQENEKPMVCKSINRQLIAGFTGQPNTDFWGGVKIVVYVDPSVTMKGKVVGGLRCRAPKGAAAANNPGPRPQALPPAAAAAQGGDEDALPF